MPKNNSSSNPLKSLFSEKTILIVLLVLLVTGVATLVFKDKQPTQLAEPFTTEQHVSE